MLNLILTKKDEIIEKKLDYIEKTEFRNEINDILNSDLEEMIKFEFNKIVLTRESFNLGDYKKFKVNDIEDFALFLNVLAEFTYDFYMTYSKFKPTQKNLIKKVYNKIIEFIELHFEIKPL